MTDIAIIGGCGHVGLPLGIAFAKAGKSVVAVDTNADTAARVMAGEMPFLDDGAPESLRQVLAKGTFSCGLPKDVQDADAVVSVVGTPVDAHMNPQFGLMADLVDQYAPYLKDGQLFVLRSTVYPGTTAHVQELLRAHGLKLDVAFCPERVAEGHALEEITAFPQIVAGCTRNATRRARALFEVISPDLIELAPIAAELAKLFTNAWRYAQFALANQFYTMANDHGIDFYEIHRAMTDRYPRGQSFAKAGFAAGPCLLKDTVQLHAFHDNAFFMGQAAIMINEGLPNYIVGRLKKRFDLKNMVVGILGMTFKANSDDIRDSLAFKLRKILAVETMKVVCTDPHLEMSSLEDVLGTADLVVIGAPHDSYRDVNFGNVPVVDVWNMIKGRLKTL